MSDQEEHHGPAVEHLECRSYRFPTPRPESDGTLTWTATVAVCVLARAGECTGLGWTYSSAAAEDLVREHLQDAVVGHPACDVRGSWERMRRALRNLGIRGLGGQAISAVDIALWDLAARLSGRSLAGMLGTSREAVPVYGSGGFTSLDDEELAEQVSGWRAAGCSAMKIKVGEAWGTSEDRDLRRVGQLRDLAGDGTELMVDANGGYDRGQARRMGAAFDDAGVRWFEEPVSSDDLAGLSIVRGSVRCDVAAGEYAATRYDAAALCPVVDCLQLDVTRCGGYTGWLECAAVAASAGLQVSAHCAPALHAPVTAAVPNLRHLEWFADHVRLEPLLVDGVPAVAGGMMTVPTGPGHGMTLREDAESWRITDA
ncbi:MAG TPA: enolase C-terminal domain-like protein [Kineosporiaceae bacterium]|nr:enolase C-terminal domain-like protein [Kineosporiaceae bacterium]